MTYLLHNGYPATIQSDRGFFSPGASMRRDASQRRSDLKRRDAYPAVDIQELSDHYLMIAELPGRTGDDIEVELNDRILVLSSKDADQATEQRRPSFRRGFVLPDDVDSTSIEARLADGLLTLTLHKLPELKPRKISITG